MKELRKWRKGTTFENACYAHYLDQNSDKFNFFHSGNATFFVRMCLKFTILNRNKKVKSDSRLLKNNKGTFSVWGSEMTINKVPGSEGRGSATAQAQLSSQCIVGWPFFQVLEIERCLRCKAGPLADTSSPFSPPLLDRGRFLFNEEDHSLLLKVMSSFFRFWWPRLASNWPDSERYVVENLAYIWSEMDGWVALSPLEIFVISGWIWRSKG